MTEPVSSVAGTWAGYKIASAFAGFLGGVVSLAFVQSLTRTLALVSVSVGVISAAALTPLAAHLFHLDSGLENGVAFLIGLVAMSALPAIKGAASRWIGRKGDAP